MVNEKQGFWNKVLYGPAPVEKRSEMLPGVTPVNWASLPNAVDVTLDKALGIPTVYRSIDLIATGVQQLSLETYRAGTKIDNPLLVSKPDDNRSLGSFLKRTAFDLAANGNAFWKITYKTTTRPDGSTYKTAINLEVLNPLLVAVEFSPTGVKSYTYGDNKYRDDQIKHLRNMEVPGHNYGMSPIQACRELLAGTIRLRDYANNWLQNSGVPTGILKANGELDPDLAAALKAQWHKIQADGGIAVVGNGLEFTPLLMSAADVQFIESMNLSDLQIARAYGIDPAFLALNTGGSSLTYTNRQDLDVQFIRYTLFKYLIEIEDAFSSILPRGTEVKFNVKDFLRAYDAAAPDTSNQSKEPAPAPTADAA